MGKNKTASNVVLTPKEIEYCLNRFKKKTYTRSTELPMSPRQAADLEDKFRLLNRNKK